jgi:glycerol-3-phosphate acyltransferase PlsY
VNPYLTTALGSYLSGSIPFGYLLVRAVRGEDIRKSGSGNIGATNVSRRSPGLGVATLLLDALKGFVPVTLAARALPGTAGATLGALAGLMAIVGHLFPVWLKFRGGKGVATGLGAWAGFAPKSVLIMVAVFVLMVAIFRYISLGSVVAAAIFPIAAHMLGEDHGLVPVLGCMTAASLLIITKHQANIRRLLAGTETKFRQKKT